METIARDLWQREPGIFYVEECGITMIHFGPSIDEWRKSKIMKHEFVIGIVSIKNTCSIYQFN